MEGLVGGTRVAAIFAMGLVFAMVFRRSGNLWIVAVMHGIGNSYIAGSLGTVRERGRLHLIENGADVSAAHSWPLG